MSVQKIAISTDDKLHINEHLGRCRFLATYELEENNIINEKIIENSFLHHEHKVQTSDNHSHADFIDALQDCDVVITGGIGPGLEKDLQRSGIQVIVAKETGLLTQILFRYLTNQLTENPERVCHCLHK